jgi:hypothetical protein
MPLDAPVIKATRPRQRLELVSADMAGVYRGEVLGDHAGVRASSLLVIGSLFVLACAEATSPEPAPRSNSVADEPVTAEPVQIADASPPSVVESPIDPPIDSQAEPLVEPPELPATEPKPSEAQPPLAPILPSGPKPGSPEADAELAELLEESTLTQEEFDAAFRKNKPKIEGDQFVFGPGDRTRKAPVVSLGTPKIEGSTIAASELTKLAKAHLRGFEGCLAVALVDNPDTKASVTLRVRFDKQGKVSEAKAEGAAAGAALRECLAAVASNWTLAGAAGASVELLLSLRSE